MSGLQALQRLVGSLTYKPGWAFKVSGPGGRFLCIYATTPDSNNPAQQRTTQHMFELTDDVVDVVCWVFDRLNDVERHEVGEFLTVAGERPFMPHHQGEGDPYAVVDRRDPT